MTWELCSRYWTIGVNYYSTWRCFYFVRCLIENTIQQLALVLIMMMYDMGTSLTILNYHRQLLFVVTLLLLCRDVWVKIICVKNIYIVVLSKILFVKSISHSSHIFFRHPRNVYHTYISLWRNFIMYRLKCLNSRFMGRVWPVCMDCAISQNLINGYSYWLYKQAVVMTPFSIAGA